MDNDLFANVDQYIADRLLRPSQALEAALRTSEEHGLRAINVAPNQGKMLALLATTIGARRVLEIGTLGGYSTLWLASGAPDGHIITLELSPANAEIARANFERAGLQGRIEVRVGDARESLTRLAAEAPPPFDMFFIDADKASIPEYVSWALRLGRKGSLIVVDNVVRGGKIIDATNPDPNVQGVRRFYDLLASEPRLSATAIQTVGSKGHDGFALAIITG